MIDAATGEVCFHDGLSIVAHSPIQPLLATSPSPRLRRLPGSSRKWHSLGAHPSDHGMFEVEVVSGPESRVQAVFLAHIDPKYGSPKGGEAERGAYHEAVILADLKGQREFSWGEVGCNLSDTGKKEWLVVAYTQGPHVPTPPKGISPHLTEHEPASDDLPSGIAPFKCPASTHLNEK